MRKIIFLDIDGVLNSKETLGRSVRGQGVEGIDPYLTIILDRIVQATGAEVVLSSTWRHGEKSRKEIFDKVVKFIDITPVCCTRIRGAEIHSWLSNNVKGFNSTYKGDFKIAILDDDSDMLMWQKDHFFQTSFEEGLTPEIAEKVIEHLGRKE